MKAGLELHTEAQLQAIWGASALSLRPVGVPRRCTACGCLVDVLEAPPGFLNNVELWGEFRCGDCMNGKGW